MLRRSHRYYCLDKKDFDSFDVSELSLHADLWLRRLQRENMVVARENQMEADTIPHGNAAFDERVGVKHYDR